MSECKLIIEGTWVHSDWDMHSDRDMHSDQDMQTQLALGILAVVVVGSLGSSGC